MSGEEIFSKGTLEMSTEPVAGPVGDIVAWGDMIPNRIFTVVAVLFFLFVLSDYLRLLPQLLSCLSRFRANISLQHSVSQARTRNVVAGASVLPLCLLADRFGLFTPGFVTGAPAGWRIPVLIGTVFAFLLLRWIPTLIVRPRRMGLEESRAAFYAFYNYMILAVSSMVLSFILLSIFNVPDSVVRVVFLVEIALVYFIDIVRTAQIFGAKCTIISTFLYLCALEFLPAGILIFTSTL